MAVLLAWRAAARDAQLARPPYAWSLFRHPNLRNDLLREGWRDIFRVFLLAIVVDVVYQLLVEGWFYPLETITLAVSVAIIPYLLTRTIVNPASRFMRSNK